jgi:hypothetical protein
MIDTDKYEGYYPEGPWKITEGQPYDDEASHLDIVGANGVLVTETSYFTDSKDCPTLLLLADAPLLLAKVERLNEQKKFLTVLFKSMNAGNWYEKYCTAIRCMEDWEDEEE